MDIRFQVKKKLILAQAPLVLKLYQLLFLFRPVLQLSASRFHFSLSMQCNAMQLPVSSFHY